MNPKFVDVAGINTRYFEMGSGDPLVLVHGGQYGSLTNAYTWSLNFEGLSKHFHVYALDKLGMGHTDNPKSDQDYTFDATVDHIHSFIETLGMDGVTLGGHSRGALPVTRISIDHPDLVRNLLICDSNTLAPDELTSSEKNFYQSFQKTALSEATRESVQSEPIANAYSTKHITADYVDELYKIAHLPKTEEALHKLEVAESPFYPSLKKLKQETLQMIEDGRLKAPTLITWGFNDPSAGVRLGLHLMEIIGAKVPRSHLHVFNEAGHHVYREHPDDFNRVVTTFTKMS